jgi:5,10-methylenetetrahydromethanopterin reductase
MVRFGIEFVPYRTMETMVALAKQVEKTGFDYIWVCDHYHNRYVHSVLARLALATERVKLGPGVTNPYLVHPAVTAAAIATLDELSKGRAVLGISSGDPFFLSTVGVESRRPLTAVREAIHITRELLAGKQINFSGEAFVCRGARLRFKPIAKVPIYVGGRGPRMLELAGSLADGVLINASEYDDIRECVQHIKNGAESVGRKLKELDVVAYMATSINTDIVRARDSARTVVAFVASSAPPSSLERHGIAAADIQKIRDKLRVGRIQDAAAAVNDRMIDAFSVCGTPAVLARHVEGLIKMGINQTVIGSPIGPEPTKSINSIKKILF